MRLLKEQEYVHVTIWQTYVSGYDLSDEGGPTPFRDVIMGNVKSERAAENYLRSKLGNPHISVTSVETVRGKWRAPLSEFLAIAELKHEEK